MKSTEDRPEERPEEEWLKDLEEAKYLEQTAKYLLEDAANLRRGAYECLRKKELEREAVSPEWIAYLQAAFEEAVKESEAEPPPEPPNPVP